MRTALWRKGRTYPVILCTDLNDTPFSYAYHQVSSNLNDAFKESGFGLGLILCKDFIEKNGGYIKVESDEGFGSTFTFSLPKWNPISVN